MAGPDRVRLRDEDELVHVRLVEQRRTDTGAETGNHPATGRTAKGHRTDAVHGDDVHRPVPLAEVARATHQGPRGAGADEEHVQIRKLVADLRGGRAVVRL